MQRPLTHAGTQFEAITPADSDITPTRAVWVGGAGNIAVIGVDDTNAVTIPGVQAGTLLPIAVKRIAATGTTATNIVAIR